MLWAPGFVVGERRFGHDYNTRAAALDLTAYACCVLACVNTHRVAPRSNLGRIAMASRPDRILTTHTGSLHRPPDLEEMFRQKLAGERYDEQAFEARLASSVAEIVRRQADIGIDLIDDGELSKVDFYSYAKYRLEGIETRPVVKAASGDTRMSTTYLNPAMKSVMVSPQVRQKFAQFYADTEPPGGVASPGSVIQLYMPVGTALEKPASYAVVGPLKYKRQEV